MTDWLSVASNAATILTAAVATAAAVLYWWQRNARRVRLERYLETASLENDGRLGPNRRVPHLMVNCYMTEAQLYEAALASDKIKPWVASDEDGDETEVIMFGLTEGARRQARRRKSPSSN